ncbi:MAG: replicative DNA helicase [Bdellovibrionales bacterium]|nr:replicative DNA helicase [Bdellovibrionales bacterium]
MKRTNLSLQSENGQSENGDPRGEPQSSAVDRGGFSEGSFPARQPRFDGDFSAGRVPPHSMDSEQAVLGGVLLDNEALNPAMEVLRGNDFYKKAHEYIWDAMVSLADRHEPIDVVTLTAELSSTNQLDAVGGVEYVSYLIDAVPTAANTQYYARIVKEMSLRRRLIHEAGEIVEEAMNTRGHIDAFIDSVERRVFQISESRVNQSFARVGEVVKDSIKHVEHLYMNKGQLTGIPSGFYDLDDMTSGFQASDFIIVAGRPSMGKTALALSIVRHIGVDCTKRVAVFSLEMSKEQITLRLLCSEARVSNSLVRSGNLGESDFPKLVEAASKIAQADIFIDDTPAISVLEMRAKARRLHKESPLSMIVVDYLQLMRGSERASERREQEISEISASLKAIAKELHIPVIALSQLNRAVETRQDKRPVMADLRESGAIEQDADIIGFVYRDEVYHPDTPDKGVAEFIIAKHRNGPVGTVRLSFQGEFTLFENLAEQTDEYDYLGQDLPLGADEDDDLL